MRETRELERYLAESANTADLERRMREWEKSGRNIWRPFY